MKLRPVILILLICTLLSYGIGILWIFNKTLMPRFDSIDKEIMRSNAYFVQKLFNNLHESQTALVRIYAGRKQMYDFFLSPEEGMPFVENALSPKMLEESGFDGVVLFSASGKLLYSIFRDTNGQYGPLPEEIRSGISPDSFVFPAGTTTITRFLQYTDKIYSLVAAPVDTPQGEAVSPGLGVALFEFSEEKLSRVSTIAQLRLKLVLPEELEGNPNVVQATVSGSAVWPVDADTCAFMLSYPLGDSASPDAMFAILAEGERKSLQAARNVLEFLESSIVVLCIGMTVFITVALERMLLRPLSLLQQGLRAIENGSADQVPVPERSASVFRTLSTSINSMIDAVRQEEQKREFAVEANKAKSRFLANMSHEIRTPMNAIVGLSYLLRRTKLDIRQRDYAEKIHASANSLLGVINDILDFSKIEASKLTLEEAPFNLETLFDNVAALFQADCAEKGLEFVIDCPADIPRRLKGDSLRVTQVLTNLTSNSVKFTHKGEVVISCAQQARTESGILLEFSVRDTGIGMTAEQVRNLFAPFTQADESTARLYGGTGLGLSISRSLVKLMGGDLSIDSVYGQGTRIRFTCPFGVAAGAEKPVSTPLERVRDKRVLIMASNASTQAVWENMIAGFGMDPSRESDVERGLAVLEEASILGRPFSLVLLDKDMDGVNSAEITMKIRQTAVPPRSIPVIMVAFSDMSEMELKSIPLLPDAYLLKPVSRRVMWATVAEVLSRNEKLALSASENADSAIGQAVFPDEDFTGGAPAGHDMPCFEGKHVLLVEDNLINREIAEELLRDVGLDLTLASDGKEALERIYTSNRKPPFDLVLMDLQMPGMDGYEATRILRSDPRYKDLVIIAMTAHAVVEEQERCRELGMNGHIAKPIDVGGLYETLRNVFRTEQSGLRPGKLPVPLREPHANSPEKENILQRLLSPDMRIFAVGEALQRLGGNVDIYLALMSRFYWYYNKKLPELREAAERNNSSSLHVSAQIIRGIANSLGNQELERAASALETACLRRWSRQGIRENAHAMCIQLEAACSSIARTFPDLAQRGGDAFETFHTSEPAA